MQPRREPILGFVHQSGALDQRAACHARHLVLKVSAFFALLMGEHSRWPPEPRWRV